MSQNEQRRPARNAAANTVPANVAAAAVTLAELARLIDARERLVLAIDELEAGEDGVDPCRVLLEGLLLDFDWAVKAT